jgi:endoglycosylceramidase
MKSIATALMATIAAVQAQTAPIHIDSNMRMMADKDGRAIIFHGVNVVYKVDPFIPSDGEFDSQNSLNIKDIADLKKWGMNFVRLGVMWEAVEKQAGVYDDDYLDKVEVLINKLGQAGIYTLVDMHQDVWARSICGEGIPNFYAR